MGEGSRRRRLCEDGAIDASKRTREHEPSPGAQSVEKRGGALQRFRDASLQSDVPAALDTCKKIKYLAARWASTKALAQASMK